MRIRIRALAAAAGLFLAGSITAAPAPAGAAASRPQASTGAAAIIAGTGQAVARSVTISGATASARAAAQSAVRGPLGLDGKPAASSLPARASSGARPGPASTAVSTGEPNGSGAATGASARALATQAAAAPSAAAQIGFRGVTQATSGCATCQTPDVSAAVNGTEMAETVNLSLQVFAKGGATLCATGLSTLLGAYTGLSHPRIQYDNVYKRFSLVTDSVPASGTDVPIQYLATSQTDDACGAWWVYSIVFSGTSFYPFGAVLDYPYLGQDSTSILSSTNNFTFGGSYLGSAAYAMPKAAAYSGAAFSFTTYSVALSTAPVTVAGIPMSATANTYWLASVPGTGYDLYVMPTNPAGAITLQAVIRASFSAPTRMVNQPGTAETLNPLDGRITSAAVQDGSYVWFAHGANDAGFPTIRYGAINVATDQAFTAVAYHSARSDDFNPSIAVSPAGGNTDYIWLNWAYTVTVNGVPVSDTVAGVSPGQGVPNEIASDLPLVTGFSTSSISSFGSYSSAEIDPVALNASCPAGLTALTAQEFFISGGSWATQLARTSFC